MYPAIAGVGVEVSPIELPRENVRAAFEGWGKSHPNAFTEQQVVEW